MSDFLKPKQKVSAKTQKDRKFESDLVVFVVVVFWFKVIYYLSFYLLTSEKDRS